MKKHYRHWRGVSSELRQISKDHRANMTPAETVLWESLRGEALPGIRFRNQHAWETFIFDFYCPKHRLIVEVDGGYHDEPDQVEKDRLRNLTLSNCGFKTLRFRNEEIFSHLPSVLERIKSHVSPHPPCRTGAKAK